MNIVLHVSKYYDWEPTPPGVEPEESDVRARRTKQASGGGWLMRVTREATSHVSVSLREAEVIGTIVGDYNRDHVVRTRSAAVATFLTRSICPHHAHRRWVTDVELSDSGPDEVLMRATLDEHEACGNIEEDEAGEIMAAYLEDRGAPGLQDDLLAHFGLGPLAPVSGDAAR